VAARVADSGAVVVDGYVDIDGACQYLACARHRIYDLCRRGNLKHARDGKRLLFRREWLDDILDQRRAA